MLIEVKGGGKKMTELFYANFLVVQVMENYGQILVLDHKALRQLSKVYVKVYGKMKDGSIKYYKDGYSDIRGRFDYTSLNTDELNMVEKFSILIFSESHGAVIKEANPPKQ